MLDHLTEVSVYVRDSLILQQRLPAGAFLIGTDEQAHIRIQAEHVHARHALLFVGNETWEIESLIDDGISVGERAVGTRSTIAPGERVVLGSACLSLCRLAPGDDSGAPADGRSAVRRLLPAEAHGAKKFQVGHQVAEGGQGVIVDAHEITIQRTVAMKLMQDCSDAGMVARFIQEAQITAQLEHPNIVPVHELSVNELDQPYYTMKFVHGTSLGHVLAMLRQRDPETIQKYPLIALLTILQKVCDAVAFAHSRGVIHRDLKPDNVMLGEYGEALLMDWGLAKYLDRESQVDHWGERQWRVGGEAGDSVAGSEFFGGSTMVGTVIGTPQYMSPEQAGGEVLALSTSTDIYALGAILYHILTLEMPFGGRDTSEVLARVRAGDLLPFARGSHPEKLPHLPGGRIPDSLEAVARRAMSLQPEERYATVKDLQADIEAYQSGFATVAEHAGAWKLFKLFLARHRTVSLAAALLLLAGVIFTGYTIKQRRIADRASRTAIAQRDLAEEHLYRTNMLEAGRHIDEGRPTSAEALLVQHRQETSGRDLRGWEWFYQLARLNRERLRVQAHRDGVFAIAVSDDGARIATAGGDGEIAVWESRGLTPIFRVTAHHGAAYALSWSKDGSYLASGGADGFVRVWDVADRKQIAESRIASGNAVRAVAWKPGLSEPPTLAVGGIDPHIYLWKPLAAGAEGKLAPCLSTKDGVMALQWTPSGRSLIIGAVNTGKSLVIFDSQTGDEHVVDHPLDSNVFAVAVSPDGKRLAAPSKHRYLVVFEMDGPTKARGLVQPVAHRGLVTAMAWSPDSNHLISAGLDGTILVYSADSEWQSSIMASQPGGVHALAWARLGTSNRGEEESEAIISGGADGTLRVWSAHPDSDVTFPEENWVTAAQWSPKGQTVASAAFRDRINLLDLFSGQSVSIPTRSRTGVHDLAWSHSGETIATTSRFGNIVELFNTTNGHLVGSFPMPEPERVYWSPSGDMVVGCGHGGARCWEVKTARLVWNIPGIFGSAAWLAGGAQVAMGGADGSIKVFESATGRPLPTWRQAQSELPGSLPSEFEPPQQVFDLATSPDGHFLAFGTQDGAAGLLDTRDGSQVRTFEGHISGIRQVAWRPDGSRLATVGEDGTVRVFNPQDGSQVVDMNHGSGDSKLKTVAWDPSGDRMLTGGWDTRMRLWDASRGYLIAEVAALKTRADQSPDDVEVWRALAEKCTQLGWPDRAHEAFARITALTGDEATTAAQAAKADWIFAHALEGVRLPEVRLSPGFHVSAESAERLRALRQYIEDGRMRAAVETWRLLAQSEDGKASLPLARMCFSKAKSWKVTWFTCDNDPVTDLEGWRAAAAKHTAVDQPMLCFPFQNHSPKALGLVSSKSDDVPDTPVFNMVATDRRMLPAGKWRCTVAGGSGCRVMVGGRTVLEQWTGTMEPKVTADFEQASDVEVEIRVESFLRQPVEHFDFTMEPLL